MELTRLLEATDSDADEAASDDDATIDRETPTLASHAAIDAASTLLRAGFDAENDLLNEAEVL